MVVTEDSSTTVPRDGKPARSVVVDDGTPRVGDVIAGKFEVTRVLGAGGMGIVVAVKHLQLREPYAMKFLLPHAVANPETVERFLREARAAVRIKSEHVARVADVGQLPDGVPYLLMEYLEGRDLSALIDDGPVSVDEALECLLQACAGIAEAHALGFVHRDLKPSNLFLTQRSDGAPLIKVLDFGIAKALETSEDAPSLTVTQAVFGTPAYMSPEQIRSAKNVDIRTDIWALGVILHELLTAKLPFTGQTSTAILAAISADEPSPIDRPDVGPELQAVVARCLAKDRTKRFQTIAELADALSKLAKTTTISLNRIRRLETTSVRAASLVPPASRAELAPTVAAVSQREPKTGSPLLFIALGATGLAVAAIGIVIFLATRPEPAPAHVLITAPAETVTVLVPQPATSAPPPPTVTAAAAAPKPRPRLTHGVTPPPPPAPRPPPAKPDPVGDSH